MVPVMQLTDEEFERTVRLAMNKYGLDVREAREFVWTGLGVSDVRFSRPLTEEERRRFGVGIGPCDESVSTRASIRTEGTG
jgi:hypothetical protein